MLCIQQKNHRHFLRVVKKNLQNTCYSIKKDGVRCWAVHKLKDNTTKYLSRSGKEFTNFGVAFDEDISQAVHKLLELHPELETDELQYIIFDGEVDAVDRKGTEGFQKLMTQVTKLKDVDPEIFRFHIFDIVLDNVIFSKRYQYLYDLFNNTSFVKILLLEHFATPATAKTIADLDEIAQKYIEQGEEGVVFKVLDSLYEYKRSNYWIKFKKSETADVQVVGWEYGTGKNSKVMGKLNCLYESKPFNVGSGFSDKEREEFMKNTPNLIEINFHDLTKEGIPRHGTFIRVREDK